MIVDPSNPVTVCCIPEGNLKDVYQLYKAINEYAKTRKSDQYGTPGDEKACLANCNDQWHRAIVMQTFGDGKPLCTLIDIFSVQNVPVENIIPMPSVFKNPSPLVAFAAIDGVDEKTSQDVLNQIQTILKEGSIVNIDEVVQEDDESYRFKVKAIAELLKAKKEADVSDSA